MNVYFVRSPYVLLMIFLFAFATRVNGQGYVLEDAERFSQLFQETSADLSADVLQSKYLTPGSRGIEIFTPNRIENAENLAAFIAKNREMYERALAICLPAVRTAEPEVSRVLEEIRTLLKQDRSAPVYVVFGAGNSGGTADTDGLVIGLEVICRFAKTAGEARETIRQFVAHEIIHVYQHRLWSEENRDLERDFTLLEQALMEGFADFLADLATGGVSASERQRHEYGLAHEATLWTEFTAAMDSTAYSPWMYGPGRDGRPSDLGYWIGKRIAAFYYERSTDKSQALQDLLSLEDPHQILRNSRYAPE